MLKLEEVVSIIKNASNIAIFAHRNPDPDACGSMFAMKSLCQKLGKKAQVFTKILPDSNLREIYPVETAKEKFEGQFDLFVLLDVHVQSMVEPDFLELLINNQDKILIVDHHLILEEKGFDTENFYIEHKASASQLVLELFKTADLQIDNETANYIYAGIVGDTARFLHSNTTKEVFESAEFLLDSGADLQKVYNGLFRSRTMKHLHIQKFFCNNVRFLLNNEAGYIVFSLKDMKMLNVGKEDVKFLCNEITTVKGVKISFLCIETSKNYYKLSLRANHNINVVNFANKMGGGGHISAAGCEVATTKRKLRKQIKVWAEEILRQANLEN
ncbi:MAG: bifunctional oligoribonuclease/PAP phosphatase NrnA [Clostridia bacterium]|nr:bifunctional oligoribonuclease/PAP phosphatase NrnA [Clostridia bacterium]